MSLERFDPADSIGAGVRWVTASAAYTVQKGDGVLANTSSSGFTVTLPANPSVGDPAIPFADAGRSWGSNSLTIDGNGNPILGASTFTADVTDWAFSLVYDGNQWVFGSRP